jgi:spermidine/putrescine ABC transporter ATP-binding subunit
MSGIRLENVFKAYGDATVVRDLSLTIPQGEFFTLLGPSGSGKTTTLSIIAGFTMADRGRVFINGRDATRAEPRERGLGMVFQNYAIFPHLNVFENVAFPLTVKKVPKVEIAKRVADALEMVKLTGFERRYARQLSGGQQQRVALARAIVAHPPIVLMDEPLGALDKNLRYHMQMEIKEISTRLGMTVVYVTHDQEEALTMSDRIAIMNGGVIAQMGPPREVYERPQSAFVAKFLGEANLIRVERQSGCLVGPGSLPVRAGEDNGSLQKGQLFLRPEKVTLCDPGTGEAGCTLRGKVHQVAFLGNVIRFEVELEDGTIILSDVANAAGIKNFPVGAAVDVTWLPEHARLLED